MASLIGAGLDGIDRELQPDAPTDRNIYSMTESELAEAGIEQLPMTLDYALDELEIDDVVKASLGQHITENFISSKRLECNEYAMQVSQWELDHYFQAY